MATENALDVTQMGSEAIPLTPYFSVLEDPDATLSVSDVSQPAYAARFKAGPAQGSALGFGFTRSVIWLRLHVKNTGEQPIDRVLEIAYALLAKVDFYQSDARGSLHIEAGYTRPQWAHALPSRFIALPVSLPAGADQFLYLRVQTPNSLNVPARLWSTEAFHVHEPGDYVMQSLYFGVVLALVFYNLSLFVALRDANYLLYVLVSGGVALGLATFTGMGSTFVWGFAPFWTKVGVNVSTAVASVAILILARRLMSTRQFMPRVDWWLRGCIAANSVFGILLMVWFQEVNPLFIVLSGVTALLIWGTGVACAIQRQRSAYYFVIAFTVLLLANVLTHLRNLGLAPTNFFTSDGLQIGSVLEVLLLSLALADRFNVLRREKIMAQTQALQTQGVLVEKLQESERHLESRVLKRTEQLQTSLNTLRLRDHALGQISQGVLISNALGLLTDINDASVAITGYPREELLGKPCKSLQGPDTDPQTVQAIREALQQAQPFHGEILNYRRDGTPFWNELSIAPVFDEAGALSQFVGVQRDITERKKSAFALLDGSALLAATIESMAQGLLVIGADQRIKLFNSRLCELLDLPRSLLESWPTFAQLSRYQHDRGDFGADLSALPLHGRAYAQGHRLDFEQNILTHYVRKTPAGRSLEVRTYSMPSGDVVRTFSDVTDFAKAREDAEAATRAKSRFLATMSHEIRTPMNGILGMAQVLALPDINAGQRTEYAHTIVQSGQTLLSLLNDILDLSRVEAGQLQLESAVLDPWALLVQVESLYREHSQTAGLVLESRWTGAPDACYLGDVHRLRQMLSNLVSNAIKFTEHGRISIEGSEISSDADATLIELSVSDTGVGIAPENQPALFQSFAQGDASITRRYGGSGLGLSIVRNLAELMGGSVGVNSVPGQGSRFWFRVRLVPGTRDACEPLQLCEAEPSPSRQSTRLRGRVLVAEDDCASQRVIQALLAQHGVEVTLVDNGQKALEAVMASYSDDPFDLVLMDLQMPVMDGCEATRRLRQWEVQTRRPRLPIVALTAGAFDNDRNECLQAGMDAVLTKPVDMGLLHTTLARWLHGSTDAVGAVDQEPVPTIKPVDAVRMRAVLAEITPLLAQNRFDAIACFRKLQALVAGTALEGEMKQIARLLQEIRFDRVLRRLDQMAQEQGWESTV